MSYGDEMESNICPSCGIKYAAPKYFFKARRDGDQGVKNWWCPNGHSLSFTISQNDTLRRERDLLKQQIASVEDERAAAWRAAAEAAADRKKVERELKRTLNRAGAGVCPCCNRTFQSLARHMKNRHPEIAVINDQTKRTIPG